MPTGYRIEMSPNKRAVCKSTDCKKEGIKIEKGELRFATMVMFQDKTSWAYRHWGCVTPKVIENIKDYIDGDFEMIDGFEDLPEDEQNKVRRAIDQGHVDDEDWKGDVEKNRPGAGRGTHLNKTDKKRLGIEEDEDAGEKPKKRSRKAANNDEEEETPVPKKSRSKKGAAVKEEETPAAVEEEEEEFPAPKKARGRKAKAAKAEDEDVDNAPAKPRKKSTKKAAKTTTAEDEEDELAANDDKEPLPAPKAKKSRARKAAVEDAEDEDDPKPARKIKRSKAKAAPAVEENGAEDEAAEEPVEEPIEEAPKPKKSAPQKRGKKSKA